MKRAVKVALIATWLTGAAQLAGCSNSNNNEADNELPADDAPTSVLDDTALEQLEGFWEQRGYGNLYAFQSNRTTWYALTENTCLEITSFQGLPGIAPSEVSQTRFELHGEQLTLALPGDAFVTRLDRLATLPARCDNAVANDEQGVFDYLWATFDEYYAFFELRGVDWPNQYASLVPRVGDATDDAALFGLLSDLLAPIHDGHVLLANETDFYSPAVERGAIIELRRGFEAQEEITDFGVWIDTVLGQLQEVITSRLDSGSLREQGPLNWGTANDGRTGYLFIAAMEGYVIDGDGESNAEVSSAEDLAAATIAMDQAMADLANTEHLIIDVRLNGGGYDAIALDFARRFVSERRLAFSKTARSRDFESIPVVATLEPLPSGAYLNEVTLIIGADTASAAEIFTIPMQHLPQVTVIGERTAGVLSDILIKPLPNGWVTGLSNEVYLDVDGVSFEGVGVQPDSEVPVFRLEDIRAGMDPALDRALMQ